MPKIYSKKTVFQKNVALATLILGLNILSLIFLLVSTISLDIWYIKIISIIIFILFTATHILFSIYNCVRINISGLSFYLNFKKIVLKWEDITNVKIMQPGLGGNTAYSVKIFYLNKEFKFFVSLWAVTSFENMCPQDKLNYYSHVSQDKS